MTFGTWKIVGRPFRSRRWPLLASLLAGAALLSAIAAIHSTPASAASCADEFTEAHSAEWSNAENWSTKKLPEATTIVCWNSGKSPVVSFTSQADSISSGDSLTVSGGSLTLENASDPSSLSGTLTVSGGTLAIKDSASAGALTMSAGALNGPGSLSVSGAVSITEGSISSGGQALKLKQSAGSFLIGGTKQIYLQGGSIETSSPVEITNPSFITAGSPTLTTTSTIQFAPIEFGANGGVSGILTAKGIITTGQTTIQNYALHVTGNESKLEGTLTVPVLNTDKGTTVPVPSGAGLNLDGSGSMISGTISGAGTFAQTDYSTTFLSGATLSTDTVSVSGGTLLIASGATYKAATSTTVSGGTLEFEDTAETGSLTFNGGSTLGGNGTLSVSGAMLWSHGQISGGADLKIKQGAGTSFSIEGTERVYWLGGSVETESPVTIGDPEFISTDSPKLTTTSTLTLKPVAFSQNGGVSAVLSAKGLITTGNTTVENFTVDVTGNESKIEGGTTSLPVLNTSAGTTMNVASGAVLRIDGGGSMISGAITGAGTFADAAYSTTFLSGATLSTNNVLVSGGTLILNSGATYKAATETMISNGALELEDAAETGGLTMSNGSLGGPGSLALTGAFSWTGGEISSPHAIKITQSGGASFSISGSTRPYLTGGTIETTSPVSITNAELITAGNAQLTTTSTITLASGYNLHVNGGDNGTFTAAGLTANAGPEYGFGDDALVLTGGTTTVANGHTLTNGPLAVQGGVLEDDGTVKSESNQMTLTGGTLTGTGIIESNLVNSGGTLIPGNGTSGELKAENYIQEAGGTLKLSITGNTPGADFPQLVFDFGNVILEGKLYLTDEGFTPAHGETFPIVVGADSESGEFAALEGPSGSLYGVQYERGGATLTVNSTPPVNTEAPQIIGTPANGETLTCATGKWSNSPISYAYEWQLEGQPITGATESTYRATSEDEGHQLKCFVTAKNSSGEASAGSEPVSVLPAPVNTEAPEITGTAASGETLTCSTGKWSNSPTGYTYEWQLEGQPIAGATESTFKVPAADAGKKLLCVVTATNASGKTPAKSQEVSVAVPIVPPVVAPVSTAPPVVTGTVGVGNTLSCSPGTWSGSPSIFEYQWNRDNTPIAGATSSSYLVALADVGHRLTCAVTASNGVRATSASTSVLVPAPPAPTPLPLQCSGRAIVLITVRQVGHTVFLSGAALSKYAGQKVTITLSGVSKKLAKGKSGTALVAANGTFEAKLAAPTGSGAGLTRYTATVAGSSSLALKLTRKLQVTAEKPTPGGARVSFHVSSAGPGKHLVTITRELSCSKTVVYKKVKLPSSGRFTIVLPASTTAGEISYYRAQTHVLGGNTYSLPVAVAAAS